MYFKKIFMDDMGSLSYIFGCPEANVACIINPGNNIRQYLDTARKQKMLITHIFETPSNLNSSSSSTVQLRLRTNAEVYYLDENDCT